MMIWPPSYFADQFTEAQELEHEAQQQLEEEEQELIEFLESLPEAHTDRKDTP